MATDTASAREITSLEVTYSPRGSEEPTGSFTLRFPHGAPTRVTHTIRTVGGEYDLDVRIGTAVDFSKPVKKKQAVGTNFDSKSPFRSNGATRFTRPVTLNGNPTTVILKLRGFPK